MNCSALVLPRLGLGREASMTDVYVRVRESVSSLLRRLHLFGWQGWWDAGTDTVIRRRAGLSHEKGGR